MDWPQLGGSQGFAYKREDASLLFFIVHFIARPETTTMKPLEHGNGT